MASTLSNAIDFFRAFGFFDIVLPFLLVFTIVFAILEKTKILGEDKANLNAMVAFVVGLLFVGAIGLVSIINEALPNVALFLIVILSFLMLFGAFVGAEGIKFDNLLYKGGALFVVFVAVLAIFLDALGWLDVILNYVNYNWDKTVIPTAIFFLIVLGAIWYVVEGGSKKKGD